ncbi:MAG: phage tail protein [Bacteroidota bacterium]|nr:phage tail protein [Bacteroidota bacterium]
MIKIGLITEGITDQFILKPIINNFWKKIEFDFREIQPRIDETDKQEGYGSWVNVLKTCREEDFNTLFKFNDFVVIQIDSDVSQEKGFDVAHFQNGKQLSEEELCLTIIDKLKSLIPSNLFEKHQEKFLFAIGLHSSECWLLTIVEKGSKKTKTQNCLNHLNKELSRSNFGTINPKNKNNAQSRKTYQTLAKKFKNKIIIQDASGNNSGLKNFVLQLSDLSIIEQ